MTPLRLARLLDGWSPTLAWTAVAAGAHPADRDHRFREAAAGQDPSAIHDHYLAHGVRVLLPSQPGYPATLEGDPGAPAVLAALGQPDVLDGRPTVAVVGTRSATPYGARMAANLGSDLAEAGVAVVSGLALGIDAAAHTGAVRAGGAPPVAVVGTGLAHPYPRQNRVLWQQVASTGVVFSEAALESPPRPGAFPARNRIIAALADVVVVVECHARGGSLYTVEAAARRSVPVCAVPGSVLSPASTGTNALLVEGCIPVRDAADVLTAVSLVRAGRGMATPTGDHRTRDLTGPSPRPGNLDRVERAIWEAVEATPTPVETVLLRTGLSVAAAAQVAGRLVAQGLLEGGAGWWARTGCGPNPPETRQSAT